MKTSTEHESRDGEDFEDQHVLLGRVIDYSTDMAQQITTLKARIRQLEESADSSRSERRDNLPLEAMQRIARIADMHDLYEGPPCHNKRHADERVELRVRHGDDFAEVTLGDIRAVRSWLAANHDTTKGK